MGGGRENQLEAFGSFIPAEAACATLAAVRSSQATPAAVRWRSGCFGWNGPVEASRETVKMWNLPPRRVEDAGNRTIGGAAEVALL